MLSQTTEYALRVVAHLAGLANKPATTREIALATKVPQGYLAKVLQGLSRNGLVNSQRGLHGGSVLAKPPGDISLYDVVQAIDPIRRLKSCPLGLKTHGAKLCPMHRRLDDAMDAAEAIFRGSTLADLLNEPTSSKPLCDAQDGAGLKKTPITRAALTVRNKKIPIA